MNVQNKAVQQTAVPWSLIEQVVGRDLTDWDLGAARVVVIKLAEREIHPTVAALNPVVFDAVDVRNLSTDEIGKLVTVRAAFELDHGRYVFEALSGKGAVGCALSHYAVWRAFAQQPDDSAGILVLEDDAKLLAPYTSLDALLELVAADDEFLLLSSNTFWPTVDRIAGTRRGWAGQCVSGTRAYFLRPSLARALLERDAWPIDTQVDYYLRNFAYANPRRGMNTISGVVGMTTKQSCIGHSNVRCLLKFRLQTLFALAMAAMFLLVAVILQVVD